MDKIMILGAGIYQVPLIQKANDMGLYTIVCSINGNYPGFALADQCYYVDTTDEQAILRIAKKENIRGICTSGTDVAIPSIGLVCDKLGLPGPSYQAAAAASSKLLMKRLFKKHKVSSARYIEINSYEDLRQAYPSFGETCILKVTDSSGSRGIAKIGRSDNLEYIFQYCTASTHCKTLLLEEFIEGEEIGVDGFVTDGKIQLFIPHRKLVISNGKTNIPLGHELPFPMSDARRLKLLQEVQKAVSALNINTSAFNADVMLTDDNVYIIEIGARSGATGIPEIISKYCGFDYYEKILSVALGKTPAFDFKMQSACLSHLIFPHTQGTVTAISYPPIENVAVSLDVAPGDMVTKIKNGTSRIGQIIVWSESLSSARKKLNECMEFLRIDIREQEGRL